MVMREVAGLLTEIMSTRPAICANCRSSEAVISTATVSGEAPGNCVVTSMVGKSTSGSAETGSFR